METGSTTLRHGTNQEWESIAATSPQATFFHTPLWASILTEAGLARNPQCLVAEVSSDMKAAVPAMHVPRLQGLVHPWCSMPQGTYGGVLTSRACSDSEWTDILLRILGSLVPGLREPSMLLNFPPGISVPSASLPKGAAVSESSTHVLSLQPDFESLWNNKFKSNNRWSTRKAEKTGFEITDLQSREDLKLFQTLYDHAAAHWEFPLPNALIRTLADSSLKHGRQIRFRVVRHADKVIAGGVFLHHNRHVCYFLSAFDRHWGSFCPMNLLLKDEIQYACEQRFLRFDFGSSLGIESVLKFKASFGAEEVTRTSVTIRSPLWGFLTRWHKT